MEWLFMHAGGHVLEDASTGGTTKDRHWLHCGIYRNNRLRHSICRRHKEYTFRWEGLFYATLRGPGKVWIQTLPISRLAGRILAYGTYQRKEEVAFWEV